MRLHEQIPVLVLFENERDGVPDRDLERRDLAARGARPGGGTNAIDPAFEPAYQPLGSSAEAMGQVQQRSQPGQAEQPGARVSRPGLGAHHYGQCGQPAQDPVVTTFLLGLSWYVKYGTATRKVCGSLFAQCPGLCCEQSGLAR